MGAALIAASALLLIRNGVEGFRAGKDSSDALALLMEAIAENASGAGEPTPGPRPDLPPGEGARFSAMDTVVIDGVEYVGYITIPKLGIDLPVIDGVSGDLLRIAPCRMLGSVNGRDLIIAGHNFTRHFGGIPRLKPGDEVFFTDVHAAVFAFLVSDTEILEPTHIAELKAGDWDLTLFTCTFGGRQRVVVRCAAPRREEAPSRMTGSAPKRRPSPEDILRAFYFAGEGAAVKNACKNGRGMI